MQHRSPDYPIVSLPKALECVQYIYQKVQKHPEDRSTILRILGLNERSSSSERMIATLLKYGLLEMGANALLNVSDDALAICLRAPGEAERMKAIQKVAFAPMVFRTLQSAHSNSLEVPENVDLQVHLQSNNFSQNAARKVDFVYRETIAFVKQETHLITQAKEEAPPDQLPAQEHADNQEEMWPASTTVQAKQEPAPLLVAQAPIQEQQTAMPSIQAHPLQQRDGATPESNPDDERPPVLSRRIPGERASQFKLIAECSGGEITIQSFITPESEQVMFFELAKELLAKWEDLTRR